MLLAPQLNALRDIKATWPQVRCVIIGATALGFYYDMRWRMTADLDLVVALELDQFPGGLIDRPGWSAHPTKKHAFTSPEGAKLDLLPAGPDLLAKGSIEWSNGHVMNLAGMDLAFRHAEQRRIGEELVLVAPPRVVALLKMTAYLDRPAERTRDLDDLCHLLDGYVGSDDDRRWDEAAELEFSLAPAYLLGLDVGGVATSAAHRAVIRDFLDRLRPDSWQHADMRRRGPPSWTGDDDALTRRLEAFAAGIGARDGR